MNLEDKVEEAILYTTPSCWKCTEVKKLLEDTNIPYSVYIVGVHIKTSDFVKKYKVQRVPLMDTGLDVFNEDYEMKEWIKKSKHLYEPKGSNE